MKNRGSRSLILIAFILFTSILYAKDVTVTGRVAVKGNVPFYHLVLVTGTGDLKIVGPLTRKLWDRYQGKSITVQGSILSEGKGFMMLPELRITSIVKAEE